MKPDDVVNNLKDKTDECFHFKCKHGEHELISAQLDKYVEKHGIKNAQDYLKCKQKDMVYLNMPVIEHEYSVM